MSRVQFKNLVLENSNPIFKTSASQCLGCRGKGVIKRTKKMEVLLKIIQNVLSVRVKDLHILILEKLQALAKDLEVYLI